MFLLRPLSPPPLFPRGAYGGIGKLFVVLVALAHIDSKLHESLTMPCCNPAKNAVFLKKLVKHVAAETAPSIFLPPSREEKRVCV